MREPYVCRSERIARHACLCLLVPFAGQAHEEFKTLVDQLLTEFLEELGVTPERCGSCGVHAAPGTPGVGHTCGARCLCELRPRARSLRVGHVRLKRAVACSSTALRCSCWPQRCAPPTPLASARVALPCAAIAD